MEMKSAMYAGLEPHPPNAVFHISTRFNNDPNVGRKMDCGVGAFRGPQGQPMPLKTVIAAEREILKLREAGTINHEYPPIGGSQELVSNSAQLAFGKGCAHITEGRVKGIQALSGTGSLRVVAEFIRFSPVPDVELVGPRNCYVTDPTWPNHHAIFTNAGHNVKTFRYYDEPTRSLDFDGMTEDIKNMEPYSIIVLHTCAHNPTGVDPSPEQWEVIANLCEGLNLIVVFDSAYLGFASGDVDVDASAIRHFATKDLEFFVCMSYSKNFGLYDERVGAALYAARTPAAAAAVLSHLKTYSRALWSVPPQHGARIVNMVLSSDDLTASWLAELKAMGDRMLRLRTELCDALEAAVPDHDWKHIVNQKGMFSYTGLSAKVCDMLMDDHSIYLMRSGRISISGIPDGRCEYFAQAVAAALEATK